MSWSIKAENISKLYRLGMVGSSTIQDDLKKFWYKARGLEDPFLKIGESNKRDVKGGDYVWALKDINFEIKQGEVIGIIGKNGAGKSTLLKLLSKVTKPSTGIISIKGRIASLLEVGTGFHPELSGRENIFLNGAILGMKKNEIISKFDEIVDFSGCERYIDTPVKRYSSGMYVRLAFAVAAHLEPEILVVDEVLAVGDAEFQRKAIGKMKNISEGDGRTVLFVSHNMNSIKSLCTRGFLLKNGSISKTGEIETIVSAYLNQNLELSDSPTINNSVISKAQEGIFNKRNPSLKIENIELRNSSDEVTNNFFSNNPISIIININLFDRIADLRVIVELVNENNQSLLATQASDDEKYISYQQETRMQKGLYSFKCTIPSNLLAQNKYYITIQVINVKNEHFKLNKIMGFNVNYIAHNGVIYGGFEKSYFRPKFNWNLKKIY